MIAYEIKQSTNGECETIDCMVRFTTKQLSDGQCETINCYSESVGLDKAFSQSVIGGSAYHSSESSSFGLPSGSFDNSLVEPTQTFDSTVQPDTNSSLSGRGLNNLDRASQMLGNSVEIDTSFGSGASNYDRAWDMLNKQRDAWGN